MNKQLYLFALIKSMKQTEKRYFKLFNSTFEGKNKTNLKLFNAIDKQKEYDEKALKVQFANEPFVKHFAVVKSSLFNAVLKSLRVYNENNDYRRKLGQHKENFNILFSRGLIDVAKSQLDKGMKIANEYDIIEDKLHFLTAYNTLNVFLEFHNNKNKNLEEIITSPLTYVDELSERHRYKYISYQIDFLILHSTIRSKKAQQKISNIFNLPEMQAGKKLLSFRAIHARLHIFLFCYIGQKNYQKALPVSRQIIELVSQNIHYKKFQPLAVLNDYNNYIYNAVRVCTFQEVEQVMQEYLAVLNEVDNVNPAIIAGRTFEVQYFCKLEYHIFRNQFDEALKLLPNILNALKGVENILSHHIYIHFYYNFAYVYFMNGDYLKSQQYIVQLTSSSKLKKRADYLAATHLLKLFIHFELNNIEHLSYEFKNVKELLKRKEYLFDFEKHAIQLIQKLTTNNKPAEQKKIYTEHKNIFEKLFTKIENRDAFEKFNILQWINKKLKNPVNKSSNKLLKDR